MIYIVDGCDCSGKSTLADLIANAIEDKVGEAPIIAKGSSFAISKLGGEGMFNHMFTLLKYAEITDKDMIIDRFYFSNLVYASIYDFPMMNDRQFSILRDYLDKLIKEDRAVVFIVESTLEKTKQRMALRGDEYIKIEELADIKNEYENVLSDIYSVERIVRIRT